MCHRDTCHTDTALDTLTYDTLLYVLLYCRYYCTEAAYSDTPTDGVTGDVCPVGHYCPQGSSSPEPCSQGYYLDATQQVSATCL